MKTLTFILTLIASLVLSAGNSRADVNESALFEFWATNNVDQTPVTNMILTLRNLGVQDANDLGVYLDHPRYKSAAAGCIWLLALQSRPLDPLILDKYIAAYADTNKLALPRTFPPTDFFFPEDSSQMLLNLAQYADRHPSERLLAVREASSILRSKEFNASTKYSPPPQVPDASLVMISAFKYKLYSDPDLSRTAAMLLAEKVRGLWLMRGEEVKPAIEFLLKDSKAEPDFVAQQLADACSGNADSASVLLWLLVESKDNPVAAKALADFRKGPKNKEILAGIESGAIGKQKAYDEPLQRRFPK